MKHADSVRSNKLELWISFPIIALPCTPRPFLLRRETQFKLRASMPIQTLCSFQTSRRLSRLLATRKLYPYHSGYAENLIYRGNRLSAGMYDTYEGNSSWAWNFAAGLGNVEFSITVGYFRNAAAFPGKCKIYGARLILIYIIGISRYLSIRSRMLRE
jgi:hypothetical protein